MKIRRTTATLLAFFAAAQAASANPTVEVLKREDVEFIHLNPARGDAAPSAGTLWGNIREDVPSGALIRFAPDFASPPHIHNITYRGVVIEGTVHNDDPDAENLWMGPGSFWTQPAGEVHITSVGPEGGTGFLEILSGPYLVRPMAEAFDNGERPVNVEERNIVWLDASDVRWVEPSGDANGPEMAFLWGTPEAGNLNGTFLKLPQGYTGSVATDDGASLKVVVVGGDVTHGAGDLSAPTELDPGSYFGSEGEVAHSVSCATDRDCVLYVRAEGTYQVAQVD